MQKEPSYFIDNCFFKSIKSLINIIVILSSHKFKNEDNLFRSLSIIQMVWDICKLQIWKDIVQYIKYNNEYTYGIFLI